MTEKPEEVQEHEFFNLLDEKERKRLLGNLQPHFQPKIYFFFREKIGEKHEENSKAAGKRKSEK
jgi:hypothetical protein